jgi:hypothetical protein
VADEALDIGMLKELNQGKWSPKCIHHTDQW